MASGSVFSRQHPVSFSTGPTLLQILSHEFDHGFDIERLVSDGNVDRNASMVMGIAPNLSVTTRDLLTGLTLAGYDGADIATIVDYAALITTGGAKSGSNDNLSNTLQNVFAYPISIQADVNRDAILAMRCEAWHSSGTNPNTIATTATLSDASSIDYDERWQLKCVKVNGTTLASVDNVNVSFGIQTIPQRFEGKISPTGFTIIDRSPVISFRTFDVDAIVALAAISSTTQVQLQKLGNDGSFASTGSAVHITVTASGGIVFPRGLAADPRGLLVEIHANRASDGSDAIALGLGVTLS